ncbi:DUF2780 domain-containing protein [Agaribacterium sp. ZY112]|uniref:DUF2780 domain-containing protein n=1 Tax=Agaribacterium sp. ZY112 TaxID=3233574 RepID=UPI0035237E1F
MKKSLVAVMAVCLLGAGCGASNETKDSMDSAASSLSAGSLVGTDLFSSISSSLGVTEQQAQGGTGALLALAKNKLTDQGMGMMAKGLSSGSSEYASALSGIKSMDSVEAIFSQLGMDPSMVSKFTPMLMDYIGGKGGSDLTSALGKIWQQ